VSRTAPIRELTIAAAAVVAGLAIAWVDTRPTWDDTGVTAGALLLAAALAAAAGLRWWGAALLVAAPLLLAELRSLGAGVSVSLVFTAAGSLIGAGFGRIVRT
jgi:hypothetical protein